VFHAEFELVKLPTCRVHIVGALEVKTLSALEHEAHAAQSAREPGTDSLEIGLLQGPEPQEAPWLGIGRQCTQLRRFGRGEVTLDHGQRCTAKLFHIDSHGRVPAHCHRHESAGVRDIEIQTRAIEWGCEARPAFDATLELPLPGRHLRGVCRQHRALQSPCERELPPAGLRVQTLHSPDIVGRQQRGEFRLNFLRLEICVERQPDIDGVIRERERPASR
jgi:hypothetical protein